MTVAHDAATTDAIYFGTGTRNLSHAASASARAAVVLVLQSDTHNDEVTGVTYGGVAMTRVGFYNTGDWNAHYVYFLDGILPGTQNVAMTTSAGSGKVLSVSTMTAAAGSGIKYVNHTMAVGATANPSWSLTGLASGTQLMAYEWIQRVLFGSSGIGNAPATNWTAIYDEAYDAWGCKHIARQQVASSGTTLTAGWTDSSTASWEAGAVAFSEYTFARDAETVAAVYVATGTQITSHVASANARAAVVLIDQNGTTADEVTGVTYGGVSMTRLRSDTEATEAGRVYVYFLDGILPGTQNVAMTTSAATDKRLVVGTLIVPTGNTVAVAGHNTGASASVANPAWTITGLTAGTKLEAYEVIHSGLTTMTNTPAASWPLIHSTDLGAAGRGFARQSVASSGTTLACGWTAATADDFVGSSVAFKEVVPTGIFGAKVGAVNMDAAKVGTANVDKIYVGSTQIYP